MPTICLPWKGEWLKCSRSGSCRTKQTGKKRQKWQAFSGNKRQAEAELARLLHEQYGPLTDAEYDWPNSVIGLARAGTAKSLGFCTGVQVRA